MKKENVVTILYMIAVIIYSVFDISYFIYAVYVVQVLANVIRARVARRNATGDELTNMLIYSLILPDNYVCIAIVVVVAILGFIRTGIKNLKWVCLVALFLILNIVIGKVLLIKIAFSLLYYISFFAAWKFFDSYKMSDKNLVETLIRVILIQVVAIISYALTHIQGVIKSADLDWVTGSFGAFQCNILNIFCTFSGIILLQYFMKMKKKKYLFYAGISFILTVVTGSVSITIFLLISCVTTLLINVRHVKKKNLFLIAGAVFGLSIVFVCANDSWVSKDIVDLFDKEYFKNRVQKIQTYEDVFINIPSEDLKFSLLGSGIGNFSSRTALTCTGEYIEAYNRIFDVHMSEYTKEYVYPQFYKVLYLSDNLWGVTYTPYSTVISIKGETGLVGLVFLICLVVYMYRKAHKSYTATCSVSFILLLFFIDNYMEFSKVVIAFWMCYYFCIKDKGSDKIKYRDKSHLILVGSVEDDAVNGPKQIVKKLDEQYVKRDDIVYTPLILKSQSFKCKINYFISLCIKLLFTSNNMISVHSDGYKIPLIVLALSKINRKNEYFYTIHG